MAKAENKAKIVVCFLLIQVIYGNYYIIMTDITRIKNLYGKIKCKKLS